MVRQWQKNIKAAFNTATTTAINMFTKAAVAAAAAAKGTRARIIKKKNNNTVVSRTTLYETVNHCLVQCCLRHHCFVQHWKIPLYEATACFVQQFFSTLYEACFIQLWLSSCINLLRSWVCRTLLCTTLKNECSTR